MAGIFSVSGNNLPKRSAIGSDMRLKKRLEESFAQTRLNTRCALILADYRRLIPTENEYFVGDSRVAGKMARLLPALNYERSALSFTLAKWSLIILYIFVVLI